MSRLSIRARLTVAFAAALVLVLALAALFVYVRVSDELTSALDDRLETQVTELEVVAGNGELGGQTLPGPGEAEDGFSQVIGPDGEVVASTLAPEAGAAVGSESLDEARAGAGDGAEAGIVFVGEREVAGVDGEARIAVAPGPGDTVLVAGASTDDQAETLAQIAGAFAIGAPLAILIASGLGYLLATRSLAPVETIRRRADEITLERSGERLPLPAAEDEIRRLAETLNSMLDRIEASLDRERVFVADASHELRTPLAVLRAELELAQRPGRSPDEMRAALRSAVEETDRLSRLAEDLLVLARSDQGRLPVKREHAELGTLLARVRDRFAPRAGAAGREIVVDAEGELAAELDPLRVEQALGNLVDNAIAHGAGEIVLSAARANGDVAIEVSDEGGGFPEGFVPRAFERFSRADEGRTGGGSGLGLAIVRTIAEAHGGRATVEPSQNGGATVRLTIAG